MYTVEGTYCYNNWPGKRTACNNSNSGHHNDYDYCTGSPTDARQMFIAAAVSAAAAAAAEVAKTKTGQAGNFKNVHIFNAEKTQQRKLFVVERARRIIRAL